MIMTQPKASTEAIGFTVPPAAPLFLLNCKHFYVKLLNGNAVKNSQVLWSIFPLKKKINGLKEVFLRPLELQALKLPM